MRQTTKASLAKFFVALTCIAVMACGGIFLQGRDMITYCISIALLALFSVMFCGVDGADKPHLSRTLGVCAAVTAIVVAAYIIYCSTGLSETFNDFDALRQFILDGGIWGYLIFIGLTVFQVVVLPIPEAVTILLGVAIYGPTVSFVLSVIGTILGSLISFILGKVFGRRLCNWMFGEEQTDKYARILNEKGRFPFIIMLLFPAFPDDMLSMIAGITEMSYGYFIVVCLLTRPVMIGLTAYLGSGIIPFESWGIAVWVAIVCLMFVLFVVISGIKSRIENGRTAH